MRIDMSLVTLIVNFVRFAKTAQKKKILFNDTQEEMRFDMSQIFVLGENCVFRETTIRRERNEYLIHCM